MIEVMVEWQQRTTFVGAVITDLLPWIAIFPRRSSRWKSNDAVAEAHPWTLIFVTFDVKSKSSTWK